MHPLFFGTAAAQLFGVHHPPASGRPRPFAVVLCAPFGHEYMRAHRAFRQLGMLLSRAGFHVLRFDYSGTGDSHGDFAREGSVSRWVDDIGTAIEEAKDLSGCSQVALVGLRLGALLATRAAQGRRDVTALVQWDPIVSGSAYASEMLGEAADDGHAAWRPGGAGRVGVVGYPVVDTLRRELREAQLDCARLAPGLRVLAVTSGGSDEELRELAAITERMQAAGLRASSASLPAAGRWDEVADDGSMLVPQDVIQQIVTYLGPEGAR